METSSQDLLKDVGKLLALGAELPKVLSEGRKAGLYVSVNIMFGLPGKIEKHFNDLMAFVRENRKSLNSVNPAINFCSFSWVLLWAITQRSVVSILQTDRTIGECCIDRIHIRSE
jgi:radical SAM superfamily enzyme YgiQ (UPF0313 family)